MSRVFAIGPGDRGSIPSRVIPKTKKMALDAALFNTQHYKVRVKWSNPGNGVAPSPNFGVVAIEKGTFRSPSTKVTNFTFFKVIYSTTRFIFSWRNLIFIQKILPVAEKEKFRWKSAKQNHLCIWWFWWFDDFIYWRISTPNIPCIFTWLPSSSCGLILLNC